MVTIETDKCIGCAVCANICPDGFAMVDSKAVVRDETASCISAAENACPVKVIHTANSSHAQAGASGTAAASGLDTGSGVNMGTGRGLGRGGGRGRNQGTAQGQGGNCVCPSCGFRMSHNRGVPCYNIRCPKCSSVMSRG